MQVNINKDIVFWLSAFVLSVLLVAYFQGRFDGQKVIPPSLSGLQMTDVEARLVKQAIALVRDDVVEERITDTKIALQALSAHLPSKVRDAVMEALGTPDIDFMRDALDILEGCIVVVGGEK